MARRADDWAGEKVEFQCLDCNQKFTVEPYIVMSSGCLNCGHEYVKWLRFEKFRKSKKRSLSYRKVYG